MGKIEAMYSQPKELVFGAESADATHARFAAAIAGLTAVAPPGNLIAFTHGVVMTLLVSRANAGIEPLAFWRALKLPAVVVLNRATLELEKVIEKVGLDGD
jgi:broad specificity phosphatase PhoE